MTRRKLTIEEIESIAARTGATVEQAKAVLAAMSGRPIEELIKRSPKPKLPQKPKR